MRLPVFCRAPLVKKFFCNTDIPEDFEGWNNKFVWELGIILRASAGPLNSHLLWVENARTCEKCSEHTCAWYEEVMRQPTHN